MIVELAKRGALGPLGEMIERTHGLNVIGVGRVIAATGWLGDYRTVSGIWRTVGLGVFEGRRQRNGKETWGAEGFDKLKKGAVFAALLPLKQHGGGPPTEDEAQAEEDAAEVDTGKRRRARPKRTGYTNPYAAVYDYRRSLTAGKVTADGKPWSKGRQHLDAWGLMCKEVLRDMALACGCQDRRAAKPSYRKLWEEQEGARR